MKLTVKNIQGEAVGEHDVRFEVIPDGRGTQAVHDAVVAHQAAHRSGTACAKTRGEVNGTKKKPYRQKGTGMARAGSFQSPIWVGGGVVFPPRPRDFRKKVNRTTRLLALRKALSERLKAGDVIVVDELSVPNPKTKELAGLLARLESRKGSLLIVAAGDEPNLRLASRNLAQVVLTTGDGLNTYEVLRFDKLLFTRRAFERVEQRLAE
jgi:large subunit ribosomal protein L4